MGFARIAEVGRILLVLALIAAAAMVQRLLVAAALINAVPK